MIRIGEAYGIADDLEMILEDQNNEAVRYQEISRYLDSE